LITISRRQVLHIRAVLRQSLKLARGSGPSLLFQAGPDGLRVKAWSAAAAVEYLADGQFAEEQLCMPYEFLVDCEARNDDPVKLEVSGNRPVVASWRDGNVPQLVQYDTVPSADFDEFPEMPGDFTDNSPELLKALDDAMHTTDPDTVRYATDHVQARGQSGTLAATDGRQLLMQTGFQFPWDEDLLIPRTTVFGARQLPAGESVQLGKSADYLAIRIGPWTILLKIENEKRFPEVDQHVSRSDDASAQFRLAPADADFLAKTLPCLPGDELYNQPITVDLNGAVIIRSLATDQPRPTELVLSNSTSSGEPIRTNLNRRFLTRAIQLGFRQFDLYGPKTPIVCRDDRRQYLIALLSTDSAIGPTEDVTRIESPLVVTNATPTPNRKTPGRKRANMPSTTNADNGETEPNAESQPKTNGKADQHDGSALVEQAEAVKLSLREALSKTSELIASLKRHKKQARIVQSTLASLRQLQAIDA